MHKKTRIKWSRDLKRGIKMSLAVIHSCPQSAWVRMGLCPSSQPLYSLPRSRKHVSGCFRHHKNCFEVSRCKISLVTLRIGESAVEEGHRSNVPRRFLRVDDRGVFLNGTRGISFRVIYGLLERSCRFAANSEVPNKQIHFRLRFPHMQYHWVPSESKSNS